MAIRVTPARGTTRMVSLPKDVIKVPPKHTVAMAKPSAVIKPPEPRNSFKVPRAPGGSRGSYTYRRPESVYG